MNEGHSSFLALELLRKHEMNIKRLETCVSLLRTPVEAGHDKFPYDLVREVLGGRDRLNMTFLALNLSNYINGVAKRHKMVSKEIFPSYEIHAITNGVHSYTWACESFRRLYDKYTLGWVHEPELLIRVDIIPDDEIWLAHLEAKKNLINYVNLITSIPQRTLARI